MRNVLRVLLALVLPVSLAAQQHDAGHHAPGATHIEAMAAAVRKHHGKTILVVGHSNTIMQYIAALGGPRRADLCDHQYNGIYTLVMIHGEVHLVQGEYGGPNPPAAPGCPAMAAPAARP